VSSTLPTELFARIRSSFSLIFYIYNIDVGKASDRVGDAVNSAALAFEGSEMSLVLLAVTLC
jgi:hypothetical protein